MPGCSRSKRTWWMPSAQPVLPCKSWQRSRSTSTNTRCTKLSSTSWTRWRRRRSLCWPPSSLLPQTGTLSPTSTSQCCRPQPPRRGWMLCPCMSVASVASSGTTSSSNSSNSRAPHPQQMPWIFPWSEATHTLHHPSTGTTISTAPSQHHSPRNSKPARLAVRWSSKPPGGDPSSWCLLRQLVLGHH